MKSSSTKGCFVGGFIGLVMFVALVAISNDEPEFGGLFVVPFFVLSLGLVGALIGRLVGTPASLSRPNQADFAIWSKGCLSALIVCSLIISVLWLIAHYMA